MGLPGKTRASKKENGISKKNNQTTIITSMWFHRFDIIIVIRTKVITSYKRTKERTNERFIAGISSLSSTIQ
jgi:hypothetical protein